MLNSRIQFFFFKKSIVICPNLFIFLCFSFFLSFVSCVSHMSEFDALLASRRSF